jgi:N-acetylglucosaminyldiphosphoundecaprenol N-acetyl-beta-D-mannosaminyltransferase
MRTDVLGVGFDNVTMDEAVDRALALMEEKRSAYVVTPNPEIVQMCRKNAAVKDAVAGAALVLPDGIGVIYGAKLLKRPLRERVPGVDFSEALMGRMALTGKSVFLFGTKPGIAEQAAENLKAKYPGLVIAGTADGYFKDDGPIVEAINAARPDFLIVGLGAPKQELWMASRRERLRLGLMAGLGGSIDIFAGVKPRAPVAWQKANLEWLYQALKDPKRFKRMVKLPLFMLAVLGQKISRR